MSKDNTLLHIAFIMDGNGRWAKARHLPRHLGHKEGCERVLDIYDACREKGVKVMSLYAFSTENWNRPKAEINHLFNYLDAFFKREMDHMIKDGCRIMVSGDISKLPTKTQKTINKAIELSKHLDEFVFNICLNYGGKAEIVRATKMFAQDVLDGKRTIDSLNEENFEEYLYTKGLPPVDLLIRTSGEQRTSNYLPWQLAYAEFIFTSVPWPSFTKEEFNKCIEEFYTRSRRFGSIKDEN